MKALALLSIAFALVQLAAPAQATFVCDVKLTPVGFVALRKFPTASSLRLYKLKPWHKVELRTGGTATWAKVYGPLSIGSPKLGFVRKNLINTCG